MLINIVEHSISISSMFFLQVFKTYENNMFNTMIWCHQKKRLAVEYFKTSRVHNLNTDGTELLVYVWQAPVIVVY